MAPWKRGDWLCPGCQDHQFHRNAACRVCGHDRPRHVPRLKEKQPSQCTHEQPAQQLWILCIVPIASWTHCAIVVPSWPAPDAASSGSS